MEPEIIRTAFEMLLAGFAGVLWYLLRKVIADIRELEKSMRDQAKEFSDYKLHVSETFVHHDTFKRIEDKLDKLFERIDRKADKANS